MFDFLSSSYQRFPCSYIHIESRH